MINNLCIIYFFSFEKNYSWLTAEVWSGKFYSQNFDTKLWFVKNWMVYSSFNFIDGLYWCTAFIYLNELYFKQLLKIFFLSIWMVSSSKNEKLFLYCFFLRFDHLFFCTSIAPFLQLDVLQFFPLQDFFSSILYFLMLSLTPRMVFFP